MPTAAQKSPVAPASLPALITREERRKRRRIVAWVVVGVLVASAVTALVLWRRPREVPLSERFRVAKVVRGDLRREVRATGQLAAVTTVAVGAELSGRVQSVEVDFNDKVTAGQVLARFDVESLEAQRAQSAATALNAKAMLEQARFDLAQAVRNGTRTRGLFANGAVSRVEQETAQTTVALSRAQVSAAEAAFNAQTAAATVARTNLQNAVIRSPIDGVIIVRNIDPGQTVASLLTTPVLFTVAADLRKMEVVAAVDEADIAGVTPGQKVRFTVTAYPEREFQGVVSTARNAATLAQDVVTYGVVVELDNLDLALRPGMTASVRIETGTAQGALLVPNAALRFLAPSAARIETPRVWALVDGAVVSRPVHPGLSDGELTTLDDADVAEGFEAIVDLTPEGRKTYAPKP